MSLIGFCSYDAEHGQKPDSGARTSHWWCEDEEDPQPILRQKRS